MNKKIGYFAGAIIFVAIIGIFWAVNGQDIEEFPQTMYVCQNVCKVRAGAGESFDAVGRKRIWLQYWIWLREKTERLGIDLIKILCRQTWI